MTTRKPNRKQRIANAEAERAIYESRRIKGLDLILSELGLEVVPEGLRELTWIMYLSLANNNLTHLPEWIGELTNLRNLYLYFNPLQALPDSFGQLDRLEVLNLDRSFPSAAHEVIGELVNLHTLSIAYVGLREVPAWIRKLRKLETLHLDGNQLTRLPEWLYELPELKNLYLVGNQELKLPPEISSAERRDNVLKLLDYYFRIAGHGAAQPLNEFKLILVGRGGVGKTTLVHKLIEDEYKEFKRTPGINITKWPVKIDDEEVRAHVWDFGGQEIMHGTHRFFMTERALYVVLISGREGTEDHDAEYWLSLVRSFAGDAPTLVLLHKWDDYHFELNRELLREKYGSELVFIESDSETGHGIRELREQICKHAKKLSGLKAAWPAEWRRIKDELPAKKKSWLTFDDFCAFCQERGITTAKDQEALAESLHDLGLMLSYRKEEALRGFGVLNPQWATKGIYEMLNSSVLKEAGGKFTVKTFAEVLPEEEYPVKLHPYMLALMRKFRLCHPLDEKGQNHLIPELLTKKEPKLDAEFPPEKCLGFAYRYDFVLPEGLLPRFIVETYVHREPKYVWRTGVVLERANCRALVRGDVQGRTIAIRVVGTGNGRRELLGIIREHFERIHHSYEKLPVTEMVPVPGHPSVTIPYSELLAYEAANDDEYKVVIEGKPVKFSVKALLDGVDLPGMSRQISRGMRGFASELSVFISYSHKDSAFLDQLRGALVPYERTAALTVWSDPLIEPGQTWEGEIFSNLEQAQIVILLLSNDFLDSRFIKKELESAVERQTKGECEIVPVLVRACRYDMLPLGRIQAVIPAGKPIDEHEKKDPAWLEVTKQLDRVIARLRKR